MRIRTKTWARPELNACGYFVPDPTVHTGNWQKIFAKNQPLHLDLGCGKCTFLAKMAFCNPNINFVGMDISLDILGVGRRNIAACFEKTPIANLALTAGNIEQIAQLFGPADCVARIYINFCNPWPSAGYHKRRLTHTRQLESYKKILAPGGEIWFKTDDSSLFLASRRYFEEAGFEIIALTEDLNALSGTGNVLSEHEEKFEAMGIKTKALKARFEMP